MSHAIDSSPDYDSEGFESSRSHSSRSPSRSRSRSPSRSPPPANDIASLAATRIRPKSAAPVRPRSSKPPAATTAAVAATKQKQHQQRHQEDEINAAAAALQQSYDPSSVASSTSLTKHDKLRGLTGNAWNAKLTELVSTVKGEAYSRAPQHASLLIDSTGYSALGGHAINKYDPRTIGSSEGSYFSAQPPENYNQPEIDQKRSNEELLQIARNANHASSGVGGGGEGFSGGKGRSASGVDKIPDRFATDRESMLHTIRTLRSTVTSLKSEISSLHREVDLLDTHLTAQSTALDQAAVVKGFLRVGTQDSKPKYEKVVNAAVGESSSSSGGGAFSSSSSSSSSSTNPSSQSRMYLEEQILTLRVRERSLRSEKHTLTKEYEDAQDELGSLRSTYQQEAEEQLGRRTRVLEEIHELQEKMHHEKSKHEQEQKTMDQRIHRLRNEATNTQKQLDYERQHLTESTLRYQEELDRKSEIQAKIAAIRKRLARHG